GADPGPGRQAPSPPVRRRLGKGRCGPEKQSPAAHPARLRAAGRAHRRPPLPHDARTEPAPDDRRAVGSDRYAGRAGARPHRRRPPPAAAPDGGRPAHPPPRRPRPPPHPPPPPPPPPPRRPPPPPGRAPAPPPPSPRPPRGPGGRRHPPLPIGRPHVLTRAGA